jgi:hypothetical protein
MGVAPGRRAVRAAAGPVVPGGRAAAVPVVPGGRAAAVIPVRAAVPVVPVVSGGRAAAMVPMVVPAVPGVVVAVTY